MLTMHGLKVRHLEGNTVYMDPALLLTIEAKNEFNICCDVRPVARW